MTPDVRHPIIKNRFVARLLAIAFGLVFVAASVYFGYLTYGEINRQMTWRPVQAEVLRVESSGTARNRHAFVTYRYVVDGMAHEGSADADFPPGRVTEILVNPANAAESRIARSYLFWIVWVLASFPLGLLVIFRGEVGGKDE